MTRSIRIGLASLLVASSALVAALPTRAQTTDLESIVCGVNPEILQRTWRGYRPDRSGNIQLLPNEPDFLGQGGLPHSGPWDYINDVPLVWYGPGHIAAAGRIDRRVTLADIAPTQAELLNFDFDAPDGTTLTEALEPSPAAPPKLLVVVVWDAVGNVVLDAQPEAWPNLRSMMDRGTWYADAEVGSSPPSTAQIHASIGTGAFSRTHSLIGHHFRIGDRLVAPWDLGPRLLTAPTLGDLYDRAMNNEPVVGTVAMVDIQLGMLSHGSLWGGGDKDIAVLRELGAAEKLGPDGLGWELNPGVAPFYDLPAYVNDLPPLSSYFDEVDRADGRKDGRWIDVPFDSPSSLYGFHTPARTPYQQRAVEEVLAREGFGADDVPDLFFVNFKLTDEVGHIHTLNSDHMGDAVAAQDAALGDLELFLDEEVGAGEWVVAITADHGSTPDPALTGATALAPGLVAAAIDAEFDRDNDDTPVVEFIQPTMAHIDEEELAEGGATLEDVAAFVMTLTKRSVRSTQWPGPEATADDPAFEAAYPSAMLDTLACVPREDP